MTEHRLSRRQAIGGTGGALLTASSAGAQAIVNAKGTRLKSLSDIYVPPRSISAVNDIYSRMTVGVRVAGQGPFPFVVDTGANQSVISAELAAQLLLPRQPEAPLNGIAGVMMEPTTCAALDIGVAINRTPPSPSFRRRPSADRACLGSAISAATG